MKFEQDTFPCAHCGVAVPVKKIKRGISFLFCSPSHERAFSKGRAAKERMILLVRYQRKIVGSSRRLLHFHELKSRLDSDGRDFDGPPENAPVLWKAIWAMIDAERKQKRMQLWGSTFDEPSPQAMRQTNTV